MFGEVDAKKKLLDAKRPLPKYTEQSLLEKLYLEWTYNSNAIEGNTLTINETKVVLEGMNIPKKQQKLIIEAINSNKKITKELLRKIAFK